MIVPEKFQFRSDEEARAVMTGYIRDNFSDILGPKINLIDAADGIELIANEVDRMLEQRGMRTARTPFSKAA